MKNNKLTDEFEIYALWNIKQNNKNENIFGTLLFNQNEIRLKLPNINLNLDEKVDFLVGETQTRSISLFNLRVVRNYDNHLKHTEFLVNEMIIDTKVEDNLNEFKIDTVQFSFDKLPLFLNSSVWKSGDEDSIIKEPINKIKHKINYLNAELIEKYKWREESKITSENGLTITLTTNPYFELRYDKKKSILEIKKDIMKLRNLLTIFCGEALTISFISFKSKTVDLNGKPMPINGDIYFSQLIVERKMNQINSSYKYDDFRKSFDFILSNYFKFYDKFKPIVQNLYINIALKSLVEVQFHDAVTSLEVYHREFYPENKKLSQTMKNIKNEFTEIVNLNYKNENESESDKNELNKLINNIGKTTLKNRIKKLIIDLPEDLKEKINFNKIDFTINKKINNFAYECANTRNFHAHGSTDSKKYVFKSNDLIPVTKILNLVGEYYLMKENGLEEEVIIDGIQNTRNYQSVLKNQYSFKS